MPVWRLPAPAVASAGAGSRKPALRLYFVQEGERGRKSRWIAVGALFAHEDGEGFNVQIDAIPVGFDGRLVARQPKPEEERA